jgi:hypothetical protein
LEQSQSQKKQGLLLCAIWCLFSKFEFDIFFLSTIALIKSRLGQSDVIPPQIPKVGWVRLTSHPPLLKFNISQSANNKTPGMNSNNAIAPVTSPSIMDDAEAGLDACVMVCLLFVVCFIILFH